jgi:putative transposase
LAVVDQSDIITVDDAALEQAVEREAVICRLANNAHPDRAEFLPACWQLGVKRTRL